MLVGLFNLTVGQGRCTPAHPQVLIGVSRGTGPRGTEQQCLDAVWDMPGQCSRCLGAGVVSEMPGQPWLPVHVECWLCQRGREQGSPWHCCLCPSLSWPPVTQDPEQVPGGLPGGCAALARVCGALFVLPECAQQRWGGKEAAGLPVGRGSFGGCAVRWLGPVLVKQVPACWSPVCHG